MKKRLHYLDNLRTFLIFLVVLYHSIFVFTSSLESSWIVVDNSKNESLGLIGMYIDTFVMFGLFLISGYLIPGSVQKQSGLSFFRSKFIRLMVPWIVGVVLLIPLYKIIFLNSRNMPQEEWFSYFHWFERAGSDLWFYANNPLQGWLWFLPVLFTFQILYLALDRLQLFAFKSGVARAFLLVLCFSVGYSMIISETGNTGWYHSAVYHFQNERLLPYFLVFIFGAYLSHDGRLERLLENRKIYISANVVLTIAIGIYTAVALNLFFNLIDPDREVYFLNPFLDRTVYYLSVLLCMFSMMLLLLHAFRKWINTANPWSRALSRNSYYVYIIHMVVLGIIAVPLTGLFIPVGAKFLLLALLTYLLSNLLVSFYYWLISPRLSLRITLFVICLTGMFFYTKAHQHPTSELETLQQVSSIKGLHEAVISNDIAAVQQHISKGVDLNQKEAAGGATPLILAAVFNRNEIAILLLEAGADINKVNNQGSTALHSAAFFCHKPVVETLLRYKADCAVRNKAGATALESLSGPYEQVAPIYEYFSKILAPQGLELDMEVIKANRPIVAKLISNRCNSSDGR